MDCSFKWSWYL